MERTPVPRTRLQALIPMSLGKGKVLRQKLMAIAWVAFGVLSFVLGWQNNVALVWMASVYANVKTDWGTAEAADDSHTIAKLREIIREELDNHQCSCQRN
jgi:hypothetical protein